MPMIAPPLVLKAGDQERLEAVLRASTASVSSVLRARIVLLAAQGLANAEIARRVEVSGPTVLTWRTRYRTGGLEALTDLPRSGRPATHDEVTVLAATLAPPPEHLGVTHWSARLLGAELGISFATIARVWRKWNVQPWRTETFKFSTDPELEAKIRDVVGLYLAPPENAVVVSIDEKSQIQALDRTAPLLPMRPGNPAQQTHDYKRHGTTTLFAALEIATGQVTDRCYDRHTHAEFLDKHPRITMHFTPTSGSWLNMVEIFFGIITRQAIRRGTFTSVKDLISAIETFIDGWNERCQPFTWVKTADEIIGKINRKRTNATRH